MKRCALFLLLVLALVGCSVGASRASALTYQDEVDLEFVLNPTISITVSDDLSISDLLPGNYGDSNIITVSSSSNAIAGYTVYSTVGSSTYASNELKKDGTDNTNKFTSISTNKAALSDFSDSNWGYAWCSGTCNSESTWVSGDVGSTTNGYNGLPLYTATGVKVVDSNTPGSSTVSFKIGARAASAQVAGTYNNVINFVAVANPNPRIDYCPGKTVLYDLVACQSKGTQTETQLRASITTPTSADRTMDTSNSGVYEYDSNLYGISSDASNDSKIYYYRGVLENSPGTYGSDGSAVTYPNYVKLGTGSNASCWRIVRTTGSGGVKMIYNGIYGATASGSCANSQSNAQATSSTFSIDSNNPYGPAFGYTQNSSFTSSNTSATYGTMFGTDTDYSVNSANSGIKTNIENWFSGANGIDDYELKLESSAGYCNDRTLNTDESLSTPVSDSSVISSRTYYASAYIRNSTINSKPSLTCPRGTADLYTTSSAINGNKQLSKPAALLTADEASFAGSGYGSSVAPYHSNSYLISGSFFWLLSPDRHNSNGIAYGCRLSSYGDLYSTYSWATYGVRPVISLIPGITVASGSGTATDPWIVNP